MLPGFLGLFMLSCFPCFDVTQCVAPLCISYASGRDVSGENKVSGINKNILNIGCGGRFYRQILIIRSTGCITP
jgi:hypothetical protein